MTIIVISKGNSLVIKDATEIIQQIDGNILIRHMVDGQEHQTPPFPKDTTLALQVSL